jgi:hypothetical protein
MTSAHQLAAKFAAQDNESSARLSATGESKGLSYKHRSDDYAQGPDAWSSVSQYLHKPPAKEPDLTLGKHAVSLLPEAQRQGMLGGGEAPLPEAGGMQGDPAAMGMAPPAGVPVAPSGQETMPAEAGMQMPMDPGMQVAASAAAAAAAMSAAANSRYNSHRSEDDEPHYPRTDYNELLRHLAKRRGEPASKYGVKEGSDGHHCTKYIYKCGHIDTCKCATPKTTIIHVDELCGFECTEKAGSDRSRTVEFYLRRYLADQNEKQAADVSSFFSPEEGGTAEVVKPLDDGKFVAEIWRKPPGDSSIQAGQIRKIMKAASGWQEVKPMTMTQQRDKANGKPALTGINSDNEGQRPEGPISSVLGDLTTDINKRAFMAPIFGAAKSLAKPAAKSLAKAAPKALPKPNLRLATRPRQAARAVAKPPGPVGEALNRKAGQKAIKDYVRDTHGRKVMHNVGYGPRAQGATAPEAMRAVRQGVKKQPRLSGPSPAGATRRDAIRDHVRGAFERQPNFGGTRPTAAAQAMPPNFNPNNVIAPGVPGYTQLQSALQAARNPVMARMNQALKNQPAPNSFGGAAFGGRPRIPNSVFDPKFRGRLPGTPGAGPTHINASQVNPAWQNSAARAQAARQGDMGALQAAQRHAKPGGRAQPNTASSITTQKGAPAASANAATAQQAAAAQAMRPAASSAAPSAASSAAPSAASSAASPAATGTYSPLRATGTDGAAGWPNKVFPYAMAGLGAGTLGMGGKMTYDNMTHPDAPYVKDFAGRTADGLYEDFLQNPDHEGLRWFKENYPDEYDRRFQAKVEDRFNDYRNEYFGDDMEKQQSDKDAHCGVCPEDLGEGAQTGKRGPIGPADLEAVMKSTKDDENMPPVPKSVVALTSTHAKKAGDGEISPLAQGFLRNCQESGMSQLQVKQGLDRLAGSGRFRPDVIRELCVGFEKAAKTGLFKSILGRGKNWIGAAKPKPKPKPSTSPGGTTVPGWAKDTKRPGNLHGKSGPGKGPSPIPTKPTKPKAPATPAIAGGSTAGNMLAGGGAGLIAPEISAGVGGPGGDIAWNDPRRLAFAAAGAAGRKFLPKIHPSVAHGVNMASGGVVGSQIGRAGDAAAGVFGVDTNNFLSQAGGLIGTGARNPLAARSARPSVRALRDINTLGANGSTNKLISTLPGAAIATPAVASGISSVATAAGELLKKDAVQKEIDTWKTNPKKMAEIAALEFKAMGLKKMSEVGDFISKAADWMIDSILGEGVGASMGGLQKAAILFGALSMVGGGIGMMTGSAKGGGLLALLGGVLAAGGIFGEDIMSMISPEEQGSSEQADTTISTENAVAQQQAAAEAQKPSASAPAKTPHRIYTEN